jgi:hypothetical protein
MALELDPEQTEQKMRELLEARMQSVRALVTSRQAVTDLRAQLVEAEADDAKKYSAALSDGWTETELRKLGISPKEQKVRTRRASPRGRQTAVSSDTSGASSRTENDAED